MVVFSLPNKYLSSVGVMGGKGTSTTTVASSEVPRLRLPVPEEGARGIVETGLVGVVVPAHVPTLHDGPVAPVAPQEGRGPTLLYHC